MDAGMGKRPIQNEVISYLEMCRREGASLQQGMNYRMGGTYSVILMSVRVNAPYRDAVLPGATALIYEGHDVPRRAGLPDPKHLDQPAVTPKGKPTQNGKFHSAAQDFKKGLRAPERVRVYEKIRAGIWSYNGMFRLTESWIENDGRREVFKFRLDAAEERPDVESVQDGLAECKRIIPTHVKLEVWKRDGGKCVLCGAKEELHFDHIIPVSKGGTSASAQNVQLLCARHNIAKSDKIE